MPSFLSSSTALTVYKIEPTKIDFAEKLKQFAFQYIDSAPEPKVWGWTNIDNIFDPTWNNSVPEKGNFICFALRLDTRKVPAAVLKKHLAEAFLQEEAKNQAEGKNFISRERKKELKELHTARLLSKIEPVPNAADVAIDLNANLVLVSTCTKNILEIFEQYFELSFKVAPEPLWSFKEESPAKALFNAIQNGQLINITFEEHNYQLSSLGQVSLIDQERSVVVNNEPETIQKGLEEGLNFSKMKIGMERSDGLLFSFTLNGALELSGIKTPKVDLDPEVEPDALILEKLYLLSLVVGVLNLALEQSA